MTARTNPAADLHSPEELMQVLPQTTLVINTLPGSAEKYVTAPMLEALPAQAVYASVGRGETTDEAALIAALQSGKLAGAVLDVTEEEPLPTYSPLWDMEQVILTQHTGGGKSDELTGIANQFISNLDHFLKRTPRKPGKAFKGLLSKVSHPAVVWERTFVANYFPVFKYNTALSSTSSFPA